jgi:outer membrane protein insertion porin family
MAAPRAPAIQLRTPRGVPNLPRWTRAGKAGRSSTRILLSLLLSASGLLRAADARADEEGTAADDESAVEAAPFPDQRFGPRYVIDEVLIRGNHKTQKSIIAAEVAALGLVPGASVDASDPRVEAVRYRLLALGYFLDVRLSVTRGASRGGVVLVVDVEERGTLVINELFPSTSAATAFWGGADISETNFLGRGINLGAGFVASTTPVVPNATAGLGVRLRAIVPPIGGPYGLSLSATGLYNDGSEFYRVAGQDDDPNPQNFVASRVKRAGGVLGFGKDFRARLHAGLDFREEAVTAELPSGTRNLDFMVKPGASRLGTVTASLDLDTRSDPILPRSGMRIALGVEGATWLLGSDYNYVKTTAEASFYWPMPRGHALGLHLFGGAIAGDPPYFDRFFIGDLNLLLPRRALGINFSTLPSRDLLDTSIAHHRYDHYAGRVLVEYAIPIWRRRGFIYGGDAFLAVGLLGMASDGDFIPPGESGVSALPIDLTGDLGIRLDTYVGIFTISIANALSRTSF